jgi:isochorismate hydrolase
VSEAAGGPVAAGRPSGGGRSSAGEAGRKVVLVVDVLNGFCKTGNLASPRLAAVVPRLRAYLEAETAAGTVPVFLADTHEPDDAEFAVFPPHCVAGSGEEDVVAELADLAARGHVVRKRRFSGFCGTRLEELLAGLAPAVVEVVGVCTDICVATWWTPTTRPGTRPTKSMPSPWPTCATCWAPRWSSGATPAERRRPDRG